MTFLIQSVAVPLIQVWIYAAASGLLYLILLSRLRLSHDKRQLLFLGIAVSVFSLYLFLEDVTPHFYALLVAPAFLLLTMYLNGYLASAASGAFIVLAGVILFNHNWISLTASCLVLTGLGMLLSRKLQWMAYWRLALYSALSIIAYLVVYLGSQHWIMNEGIGLTYEELIWMTLSMIATSQLLPVMYLFVQDQAKLHRELILSEKYQSIGQLAASISHEIRNPLTTARGFLQLMNMDKLSKENFEKYRKYAFEGLDHANNIITEYLNYSKPNLEIPKPLDVKQEIESIVQWLQPYSVQKNVSIVTHHMSEETPFVKAQSKQFQQCLLNIMKNAIESMADGGLLTVHTRIVQEQVQILIRDTGVGMSSEQLKRIGKPYFTTKDSGTGLGLMVVMNLVKAMNGKILFRSKPNQGTICEIHLLRVHPSET
ncbi:ATP-binding protein [Paenibacillus sp. GCM10027627]|uniref:ATP-binding protein n=1 Tax=unclassified Paenibacillus TaxID=185978 RepID=UPI00363A9534